jgi:hypothetical protein
MSVLSKTYELSNVFNFSPSNLTDKDGWINLKDVLFMLKYTNVIKFEKLRLVIEWNSPLVKEPTLVALSINAKINMPAFQYYDIELDRSVVPLCTSDTVPQITELRIDGFNGKQISKLLIGFQSPFNATGFGKLSSYQQYKEEVQLHNDNLPITPSPINENNKLSYLQQSWGSLNMPTGAQFSKVEAAQKAKIIGTDLFNNYGWLGVDVDPFNPIVKLNMRYTRLGQGAGGNPLFDQINLYVFALVKKAVGDNKQGEAVVAEM